MFIFLKNVTLKYTGSEFYLNILHIDFEKGAQQAACEVFGDIQIMGCRFHISQAWWRKVSF